MKINDLNGDSLLDVINIKVSTEKSFVNPSNRLCIYYGKKDRDGEYFLPEVPDQIIEPEGTQLVLDIVDLNLDDRPDLIVPIVKVGLRNIISMMLRKQVEIEAETYLMQDGAYEEKPDFIIRMVMKFSYRGGPASPVYEVDDFNGDGYPDILSSLDQNKLILFSGNEREVIESDPAWRYHVPLPQNGELVSSIHLDNDSKCDVVIIYEEDIPAEDLKQTVKILMTN
jgi:hypothetical protein